MDITEIEMTATRSTSPGMGSRLQRCSKSWPVTQTYGATARTELGRTWRSVRPTAGAAL